MAASELPLFQTVFRLLKIMYKNLSTTLNEFRLLGWFSLHSTHTNSSQGSHCVLVCSLQDWVKDIGLWMEENKLNNDKTEFI